MQRSCAVRARAEVRENQMRDVSADVDQSVSPCAPLSCSWPRPGARLLYRAVCGVLCGRLALGSDLRQSVRPCRDMSLTLCIFGPGCLGNVVSRCRLPRAVYYCYCYCYCLARVESKVVDATTRPRARLSHCSTCWAASSPPRTFRRRRDVALPLAQRRVSTAAHCRIVL